jgi:hypothetical protein
MRTAFLGPVLTVVLALSFGSSPARAGDPDPASRGPVRIQAGLPIQAIQAPAPVPRPVSPPRRKTAMLITGIVVGVLSAPFLVAGARMLAQSKVDAAHSTFDIGDGDGTAALGEQVGAFFLLFSGGLHVAASIPLVACGAVSAAAPPSADPAAPLPSSLVPYAGSARSGGLQWTF